MSPIAQRVVQANPNRYSPTLFAAVGRVLGPVDVAAIPIGSYEPRWHLHLQHTDPEGAVRMAMQMGVRKSIGVHWGTWLMSDEACESRIECMESEVVLISVIADNQPPIDLEIAKRKLLFPVNDFIVTPAGRTIAIDP